eukprot:13796177-Alexandrium_andersonii.AAC.1
MRALIPSPASYANVQCCHRCYALKRTRGMAGLDTDGDDETGMLYTNFHESAVLGMPMPEM